MKIIEAIVGIVIADHVLAAPGKILYAHGDVIKFIAEYRA